jgi:hypothetical protein
VRGGLEIGHADAFGREGEQGRAAAGYQREQAVTGREALHEPQDLLRGFLAAFVGHGMARLDHRDPVGEEAVAVARDDETA